MKTIKIENSTLKITYVPVLSLRPAESNPRTWDAKAVKDLKESITKYGIVDPLLVNSAPERKGIVSGRSLPPLRHQGTRHQGSAGRLHQHSRH